MTEDSRTWSSGRWARGLAAVLLLVGLASSLAMSLGVGPDLLGRDYRRDAERGRSYLDRGMPLEALRAVADVRGPGPGAGEAMTVAGQAFIRLDQRRDAREALERALELDPEQALAAKLLAAIHIASGATRRGIDYLRRAARIDPDDPRPWMAMGKVYFTRMEYDLAIDAFEQALRRDPADREARAGLIETLLDYNRPQEAGPHTTEALRRSPDDPELLGLAARQAIDSGRADEALDLAGRALAADPEDVAALATRARAALVQGRLDAALADAERATSLAPLDVAALNLLSQAEARLGLADRASATAARRDRVRKSRELMARLALVIAERPEDVELHWRMGHLAADCGLPVLAAQSYRAALELDPRCREALGGLAALHARQEPDGPGAPITAAPPEDR